MPPTAEVMHELLEEGHRDTLLIEHLGWNHPNSAPLTAAAAGDEYELRPIAEKAGFAIYECSPGPSGAIPPYAVRRKIERSADLPFERAIVFADARRQAQVWQWVSPNPPTKLDGAGCRAGGAFGGRAGVRRAVPERAAVAQRGSGALRARARGCARRARACWCEPRTRGQRCGRGVRRGAVAPGVARARLSTGRPRASASGGAGSSAGQNG